MKYYSYYNKKTEELDMYQRLIQFWSMTFDCNENIDILDNMNFNLLIFPEIVTREEIDGLHRIEPGYTSPDGYAELSRLIRQLEYARLLRQNPGNTSALLDMVQRAGLGCGNGCTNVMNGVIHSILKLNRQRFAGKGITPEVLLALPNYTVYAAQLSNLAEEVSPVYIHTRRENHFLPQFEEIAAVISEKTAALVITYPNNPAQSTYEGKNIEELKKILRLCQQQGIFLVVDNIYQDVIFPIGRPFTEIFNLTDSIDYVLKVYGSSKDTPFYAGYRTGYWFGDPAISEIYKYYISSTENSLNTYSLSFFALNLYFKLKSLLKASPTLEDMDFFNYGVFGWNQKLHAPRLLERFQEMDLLGKYRDRINRSNTIQEEAIKEVTGFLESSRVFCDYINQNIGNLMFIRVGDEYFRQSDDEFFKALFFGARCAVLPGNVFGIPGNSGEIWFRITLLHDTRQNIIRNLAKVEDFLIKMKNNY